MVTDIRLKKNCWWYINIYNTILLDYLPQGQQAECSKLQARILKNCLNLSAGSFYNKVVQL